MSRSLMIIHPLHTNIPKPERFTWPFCYEPHPLCLLACDEVKQEIERIGPKEGKMFGVLVVEVDGGLGFLAAYSGLLEGRNQRGTHKSRNRKTADERSSLPL